MERRTLAKLISDTVTEQRGAADAIAGRTTMATSPAWYGKHRPAFYRDTTTEALQALTEVGDAMAELADLLAFYRLLWPEAHDDAPDAPGRCACGRQAESCPARAAAEAGELTWTDELGTEYPLDEAAPPGEPDAPPAEPEQPSEPTTPPE